MTRHGVVYKYESWVRQYLRVGIVSGQEAMCFCIFHDNTGTPALQVNMDKGLFICFSCSARGGMKKLMIELGQRYSEPEVGVNELRARLEALNIDATVTTQLPVLDENVLSRFSHFGTDYWTQERGFEDNTVAAFDLGFDIMENVATIPLRNQDGGLIGFIRRMLDTDSPVKYLYPKGFKRQQELFGSWLLRECAGDMVVICEGSIDAMMVWQAGFPAVAQYGSSISPEQIKLLRRLGFGQIVLFYDNDAAGRKAVAAAQGLSGHTRHGKTTWDYSPARDLRRGFLVTQATYNPDLPSDPGAMNSMEVIQAIADARPLR